MWQFLYASDAAVYASSTRQLELSLDAKASDDIALGINLKKTVLVSQTSLNYDLTINGAPLKMFNDSDFWFM